MAQNGPQRLYDECPGIKDDNGGAKAKWKVYRHERPRLHLTQAGETLQKLMAKAHEYLQRALHEEQQIAIRNYIYALEILLVRAMDSHDLVKSIAEREERRFLYKDVVPPTNNEFQQRVREMAFGLASNWETTVREPECVREAEQEAKTSDCIEFSIFWSLHFGNQRQIRYDVLAPVLKNYLWKVFELPKVPLMEEVLVTVTNKAPIKLCDDYEKTPVNCTCFQFLRLLKAFGPMEYLLEKALPLCTEEGKPVAWWAGTIEKHEVGPYLTERKYFIRYGSESGTLVREDKLTKIPIYNSQFMRGYHLWVRNKESEMEERIYPLDVVEALQKGWPDPVDEASQSYWTSLRNGMVGKTNPEEEDLAYLRFLHDFTENRNCKTILLSEISELEIKLDIPKHECFRPPESEITPPESQSSTGGDEAQIEKLTKQLADITPLRELEIEEKKLQERFQRLRFEAQEAKNCATESYEQSKIQMGKMFEKSYVTLNTAKLDVQEELDALEAQRLQRTEIENQIARLKADHSSIKLSTQAGALWKELQDLKTKISELEDQRKELEGQRLFLECVPIHNKILEYEEARNEIKQKLDEVAKESLPETVAQSRHKEQLEIEKEIERLKEELNNSISNKDFMLCHQLSEEIKNLHKVLEDIKT